MKDDLVADPVERLLSNLGRALPDLESLLRRADEEDDDHGASELKPLVDDIVGALQSVAPEGRLSSSLVKAMHLEPVMHDGVARGTPPQQAFRQARFYLELAILCARAGRSLPPDLADAASVLARLYDLDWSVSPRSPRVARGTLVSEG